MKELNRLTPFTLNHEVETNKHYLRCDGLPHCLELPFTNPETCLQLPGTHFVNMAYFASDGGIDKSVYIQELEPLFTQLREGTRPVLILERPYERCNNYNAREAYDRVCQFVKDEADVLAANGYTATIIDQLEYEDDEEEWDELLTLSLYFSKRFEFEPTLIIAKQGTLSDWVSVDQFEACCKQLGLHEQAPGRDKVVEPDFKEKHADAFNLPLSDLAHLIHFGDEALDDIFNDVEHRLFVLYLSGILPTCWPTLLDKDHLEC